MKILRYFAALASLAILAGCAGDNALIDSPDDPAVEVPDQLTLTLNVPLEEVVNLGATRVDDPALSSVTVLCYDANGSGLSTRTYTSGWTGATGGYEITVPIHKRTNSVQLVTNTSIADNASGAIDPSSIFASDPSAGVLWGKADIKDILAKGSKLNMLRNYAKVSVSSSNARFSVLGYGVCGTALQGSLAPAAGNVQPVGDEGIKVVAPTLKNGESFSFDSGNADSNGEIAVFETPAETSNADFANCARVVVRGKYNGQEYFYPIAFRLRDGSGYSETPGAYNYTPLPILRNHHYKIDILEVRGEGWISYADACKAEPDNRLTVLITDQDESVTDITANRDYMLGISGDIVVDYNQSAKITVVTSCPDPDMKPRFSTDQPSWVFANNASLGTPVAVSGITSGTNSTGRKYTVSIPLLSNDKSTEPRSAMVTVRVGDLSRTFTVTQRGRDYMRDAGRPVYVSGLPGVNASDFNYFNWLDNACQGVLPEQNRGQVRNDGLHFPAVPAYTLSYRIKALAGDIAAVKSGNFSVTTSGGYHTVTCKNAAAGLEIGELQITNANGAVISYKLYKTGWFHQLISSSYACQHDGGAISGWFYYEVVKVGGKYILDRNIGASSNKPFITTYAPYRDNNRDAIGAYFKISETKSNSPSSPQTILGRLGVSNFKIPTKDEVAAWNVAVTNVSGTVGELSKVATITTSGSYVADNRVYLPHAGYYEGDDLKYETHANIWTSTLLSGNQGFATTSPEFGYWYLYFDCYGTKTAFSNIRFCNGSCGAEPTAESIYKYMPIRLQWP